MPFLIVSTVICVGATLLLGRVAFWPTMIAFVVANASYQAGLQFYDAMLPDVSTEENRGRISGIGVGIGYLGSYVAIGLGLWLGTGNKPLLMSLIALAFLGFAIPCFLFVKERGNPNPREVFSLRMVKESTAQTIRTLRGGREYPGLLRFLVGRVFYTDAINTVIAFMGLYVVNIAIATGLDTAAGERQAQLVMLSAISFAVVGGFVWGRLTDKLGPRRTLDLVLWLWVATFVVAASIGLFAMPIGWLYLVATMAGVSLGGIWSADRPLMLRLTPPDRVGEFYGLYGMVGRFSAIVGPIIWANVARLATGSFGVAPAKAQGLNILVLLSFIFMARWILGPVTDTPRDWAALRATTAAGASSGGAGVQP
jgi:UMF1 family MFS transporter